MKHTYLLFAAVALIAMATHAGAGEEILPPLTSPAVVQTNGPQGLLSHGDWWSNSAGGNQPHLFYLYVPASVPDGFAVRLELFDPECFQTGGELDELKGSAWDETRFQLLAPDGSTIVADRTYPADALTSESWNGLAEFTPGQYGRGIYQILATTAVDDENTYRLRIVENDPDGTAGSGDEIHLAIGRSALQMLTRATAILHFYAPPGTGEILLANFGMDDNEAVVYTSPSGENIAGTVSGDGVWNNSASALLPPPGGDLVQTPQPGWWSLQLTAAGDNQFSLYGPQPFIMGDAPAAPSLSVELQNGRTQVRKGELITYSATIRNQGAAAAHACTLAVALSPGLVVTQRGEGAIAPDGSWIWTTGLLPAGAERTLTFTLFISSESTSPVAATALASGEGPFLQKYSSAPARDIDQLVVAGTISGLIWQDLNHDGKRDAGEPGMAGIKIDLYGPTLEVLASDTSDAAGAYAFRFLPIGSYQVRPDAAFLPDGWDATTTIQSEWLLVTDLGESLADINLGYNTFETPVELSRFTAVAGRGTIELAWTTQSETSNLGFHLYRSLSEEGPFTRITSALIPGAGNSQSRRNYSWSDPLPAVQGTFYYRLSDISYAGVETMHGVASATLVEAPGQFSLAQNYPNPFNSSTVITFTMPESGPVRIMIHNLLGQAVRLLVDQAREAGEHRLLWDGRDENGITVPAGVYLCTMQADEFRTTRKLQFLR